MYIYTYLYRAKALEDDSVYNALDACAYLGVDAAGLDALWAKCKKGKLEKTVK
jgi:hypothetical protein